ncbi:MAG TPA: GerMN domain-containing protein [Thermoanaerobaculia bacterium]|nr:GerMN domain-containing protein [Thermoanaerobaculia bacterium]
MRIFLIAPEDGGVTGREVGCGDSAVAVVTTLPRQQPALQGALQALLDQQGHRNSPLTGHYNALYASPLQVERIERVGSQGAEVWVHLKGYLEVEGACDGERALAQLTETALQFPDVSRAQFLLGGRPLSGLLPKDKR